MTPKERLTALEARLTILIERLDALEASLETLETNSDDYATTHHVERLEERQQENAARLEHRLRECESKARDAQDAYDVKRAVDEAISRSRRGW